jgi:hypothetical protein
MKPLLITIVMTIDAEHNTRASGNAAFLVKKPTCDESKYQQVLVYKHKAEEAIMLSKVPVDQQGRGLVNPRKGE